MTGSEFKALVQPFAGLPLSRPWRGYGTALFSEGGPLKDSYRTGKGKAEQGFDFGWSWRVETRQSILFGSQSKDLVMNRGIASLQGLTIENVSLCGQLPELRIQLSTKRWISTYATSDSKPDWSIFLPDKSWIMVHRGKIVRRKDTKLKKKI